MVAGLRTAWHVALARCGAMWRDVAGWLLFPLGYVVWVFLRGAWVGEYPYPFIDVAQLGWARVGVNALGVMGVFVVLGLVVVGLDHLLGRHRRPL
ncbi:Pr6Pr family membrane protein [Pseudoxanthomonas mexicana]